MSEDKKLPPVADDWVQRCKAADKERQRERAHENERPCP